MLHSSSNERDIFLYYFVDASFLIVSPYLFLTIL